MKKKNISQKIRDKKIIVGYTAGVFDLFHIGHLNMLKNAAALCDKLIVGVTTDELVSYKNKKAVIPFHERLEIVRNIKCVDAAVPQYDMDKIDFLLFLGRKIFKSRNTFFNKWMRNIIHTSSRDFTIFVKRSI